MADTTKLTGAALADHLEKLRAKASPGPWEEDCIATDSGAGTFYARTLFGPDLESFLDTMNSERAEFHDDSDEDGTRIVDVQGLADLTFLKAIENNFDEILAGLRATDELRAEIAGIAEKLVPPRPTPDPIKDFERVLAIADKLPTRLPDDLPLRDVFPAKWPTLGNLRDLVRHVQEERLRAHIRSQISKIPSRS